MKTKFTLLIALLIGIIYSCDNAPKKEKTENAVNQDSVLSTENTHHHSESDSIELNNGVKWIVVPDMMKYIRTMESDVHQFAETQHKELKDFTQLGASLQKNIDLLTSNCTMEGKAHDELHKWLLPYIDMVNKLNTSKNNEEALHAFEEIKASYKLFNLYFE